MRRSSLLWILPLLSLWAAPRIEAAHHQAEPSPWTRGVIRELDLEGGLAVRFRYRELKNIASIRMWGKSIVLHKIEVYPDPDAHSFGQE